MGDTVAKPVGSRGRLRFGPEFFEPLPDDEIALWEGS